MRTRVGVTSSSRCNPMRSIRAHPCTIPGGDMTFEAALTKLMVLVERHEPDEVRRLMREDLAGELTAPTP